jgi:hypothetical protein
MTQENSSEDDKSKDAAKPKRHLKRIPPDIKAAIREAVANGESRCHAAKRFGLPKSNAYHFTKDLPGLNSKCGHRVTKEERREIRKLVRCDIPKRHVAILLNRQPQAVVDHTRDIPGVHNEQKSLGTRNMHILNIILQQGYFIPEHKDFHYIRYTKHLMKNFPSIKFVRYKRGVQIFFLDIMREEAVAGFLKRFGSIVHGNSARKLEELFGINLPHKTRKDINRLIKEMRAERKKKQKEEQNEEQPV